ncbi:phage tail P2-like protein [Sphingomonas kyeonggiensis]|uniref:phage tail protein I n=1 Tax=Sphingomonas kyeonggiensis TaxID=1268553 RepID=UPI0027853FF9|nr:phage tail protein I [Sphingomonas kyeonggiensis]MDQ0250963.1 phage tail P2-like protein [Sphingomonas kyeonggiensis]
MTTDPQLLAPNATALERGVAKVSERLGEVPMPLAELWDPATCPLPILPWLAWALSVDTWDADWSEGIKREAVANSIDEHRRKGTRYSVEQVLARFDDLATIVEWHETAPRGTPHTFEVILPLVLEDGTAPGGERATAAFADQVIREVSRTKPLREHFQLVQQVTLAGGIGVQGVARVALLQREDMILTVDTSQPWATLLTDENGEPLQSEDSTFLDTAP